MAGRRRMLAAAAGGPARIGSGRHGAYRTAGARGRAVSRSLRAHCSNARITRLRPARVPRSRPVIERARRDRAQWLHRISANRHDSISLARRRPRCRSRRVPVDGHNRIGRSFASAIERTKDRPTRWTRPWPQRPAIPDRRIADVVRPRARVPPWLAAPRSPAPAKSAEIVPCPALVGHIAPGIA